MTTLVEQGHPSVPSTHTHRNVGASRLRRIISVVVVLTGNTTDTHESGASHVSSSVHAHAASPTPHTPPSSAGTVGLGVGIGVGSGVGGAVGAGIGIGVGTIGGAGVGGVGGSVKACD